MKRLRGLDKRVTLMAIGRTIGSILTIIGVDIEVREMKTL